MGICAAFQTDSALFPRSGVLVGRTWIWLQLSCVFFVTINSSFGSSSLFGFLVLFLELLAQACFLKANLFYHLALVSPPVRFELTELRKAFGAHFAAVRLFAGMQSHVLVELAGLRKSFATFTTLVRLFA